jgi:hypothetical protein
MRSYWLDDQGFVHGTGMTGGPRRANQSSNRVSCERDLGPVTASHLRVFGRRPGRRALAAVLYRGLRKGCAGGQNDIGACHLVVLSVLVPIGAGSQSALSAVYVAGTHLLSRADVLHGGAHSKDVLMTEAGDLAAAGQLAYSEQECDESFQWLWTRPSWLPNMPRFLSGRRRRRARCTRCDAAVTRPHSPQS